MVKESKEFWNKAEAIQMEEKPKAAEGAAAAPPTTPMFFPVRFDLSQLTLQGVPSACETGLG